MDIKGARGPIMVDNLEHRDDCWYPMEACRCGDLAEIDRLREFAVDLSEWVWGEFENEEDRPKVSPLCERAAALGLFKDDT